VQRLLSMVVLAAVGGLGWLFFKGGGLSQLGDSPKVAPGFPAPNSAGPYHAPGDWSTDPISTATSGSVGSPGSQEAPIGSSPAATNQAASPANGPTIRIASFNIDDFGKNKASNLAIKQTLAAIVRCFDIIAIQEIRTDDDYLIPTFLQHINRPTQSGQPGRHFRHVISRRLGDTKAKEQFAYLFDADRIAIDMQSLYTIDDPDGLLDLEPLVATFGTRGVDPNAAFTFTLVTVHTNLARVPDELDALAEVYRVVRRSSQCEDDIILLGNFNTDDRHLNRLGKIPGIFPLITGVWTNTKQNQQLDNIIIHRPSTTEYTGRNGVLDIVRMWNLSEQQALQISDHFPVWAEFSINERDHAGRIASRRRQRR
jgi:deoxyribonuclease-1-like protein